MREILFRGQTRRKGEKVRMDGTPVESNWVYGGVLQGPGDHSIIYQTEPNIEKRVVYTDTLGQFTGMTDKNGTKIFEGDIVRIGRYFNNNFYTEDNYVCKYDTNTASFKFYYIVPKDIADINKYAILGDGATLSNMECGFTIEVIGNIYDNPKLLREDGEHDE